MSLDDMVESGEVPTEAAKEAGLVIEATDGAAADDAAADAAADDAA